MNGVIYTEGGTQRLDVDRDVEPLGTALRVDHPVHRRNVGVVAPERGAT